MTVHSNSNDTVYLKTPDYLMPSALLTADVFLLSKS